MYKIIYWILGILVAMLLVLGVYILIQITQTPTASVSDTTTYTQTTTNSGNTSNTSNTSVVKAPPNPNTYKVNGQDGNPIAVKDFLHNNETVPDTVNPGYYYLAGSIGYCLGNGQCPSGYQTDDFTVTYNTSSEQFSVVLLTKPLATSRDEAEKFLMDRLGLHRIFLCNLHYYVSVPTSVDSTLAGSNLGFSACPGATAL